LNCLLRLLTGCSFIDILEATLPLDLYPTICLEGTLDISIGGLLSVGGVSVALATRGLLIDVVRSLDVITGTGECVSCSATENPDLFRSALGGLGQFGIIVGATLPLGPLPQREVSVTLYYDALCAFMGDAARFAREHETRCDGLLAGMYASSTGPIYSMQVRVFPSDSETTIAARNKVLDGLQKDLRDHRSQSAWLYEFGFHLCMPFTSKDLRIPIFMLMCYMCRDPQLCNGRATGTARTGDTVRRTAHRGASQAAVACTRHAT
jgi:FAD/FMN-containing dehydrogenase